MVFPFEIHCSKFFHSALTALFFFWGWDVTLNLKGFLPQFLWPLLSALFLIFIDLYSIPNFDLTTNPVGISGILIGIIPYGLNRHRRNTLKKRSAS